jgi:phosphocarrier protein HPr
MCVTCSTKQGNTPHKNQNEPEENPVPEQRVTIASAVGLHARPAAAFVQTASQHACDVRIGRPDGELADAKSILAVLSLALAHGEEAVVRTDGEGAQDALAQLTATLSTDHDLVR